MDLDTLIAQWSGKAPPGFVPHAVIRQEPPTCVRPRCQRPASLKSNGDYAKSCEPCRIRRAKSCRRRRKALVANGGCRRCAYRKRLPGDFLCARCRQNGISSARRSARTPSTRPPSTSSRPGPRRRTARATSTWEFRLGTAAPRGNLPQPTGRRCQTLCRSRTANGSTRCGIRAAASAAADPASSPGRATSRLRPGSLPPPASEPLRPARYRPRWRGAERWCPYSAKEINHLRWERSDDPIHRATRECPN